MYHRLQAIHNHLQPSPQPTQTLNITPADVCGIVGYIGTGNAATYLYEGLRILENRGYDSAGITTYDPETKQLVTSKFASLETTSDAMRKLGEQVPLRHQGHTIGIAHTRWATHGGKTDQNAHPHLDTDERIAVIHNGVIENYLELKDELVAEGVHFRSETDSEVIAQLIGKYVKQGTSTLEAVKKTERRMRGTWGIAVLDREHPTHLIVAKNGSPMLIGIAQGRMFIGSEPSAFSQHTKEFISLQDGEVAVVELDKSSLDISRIELAPEEEQIAQTPAPYPHWTIKEIMEQPIAISNSLNFGGRLLGDSNAKLGGLEENLHRMLSIENLVIAACGTSHFASIYGAKLMSSLGAFNTVQTIDASEITPDSIPLHGAGMLAISQSGETKDVERALLVADTAGVPTFSIVNVVRSLIARMTKCGVYLNAGRERAVASTKAFTCQVTVLALVAVWFSARRARNNDRADQRRKQTVEALHRLSTNVGMTLASVREQCKAVALALKEKRACFILGKGFAEPIAREGALKIKEITYLHCEGYPGGALKHGPFALIEEGTPVILIILTDVHEDLMRSAEREVHGRGAHTIVITNNPNLRAGDEKILIPSNGPLTALLAVIPLQLIAYELSVVRGIDPDYPRNLAKAVTVD